MKLAAIVLTGALAFQAALPQQQPTFSATTSVVIVNVTVVDANNRAIENLTEDDFEVFEDGKLQKLQSVDFQHLDNHVLPPLTEGQLRSRGPTEPKSSTAENSNQRSSASATYRDRRLIVMLFDFSSMEAAEQIRSKQAAIKFLSTQMTASDMISIMTFGTELQTIQDFTSDRDLLIAAIDRFRIGESSENAAMADTGADAQDQSGQFLADETEFNIFNSDLKLAALEDAARRLAHFPERKALIYFSSGIQKTGVDNQSQLQATVNTAVRSNVAFYPIDARGLLALVPGGDATQAGAVGTNLYSGAGQRTIKENFINQQETLGSLALETGGKALLDSNDLTDGIRQVQKDVSSYYVLAYASSNTAQDGRYRRIHVKLTSRSAHLRAKLEYRQGYYAPTTFGRMHEVDKEAQLQQALMTDNPVTDLLIAVEVDYFRLEKAKYFVPISVKIPGSALAFHSKGSKRATELDFIAEVFDPRNRPAATVRDTIPLKVNDVTAGEVARKSIQYDTGVTLAPGNYKLRFVARENGEGKVGTFESSFTVPDLGTSNALRVSSMVLSNQRDSVNQQIAEVKKNKKLLAVNPLIGDNGQKLLPNVTKVFHRGQNMFVYLEVYDPSIPGNVTNGVADVEATLALYSGQKKIFESAPIRASRLSAKRTGALPLWFQVPISKIEDGKYACQVNLIDEFGRKFAFPRTELAVVGAEPHKDL